MILWRISRHRDLRGVGGLRAGGRWHFAGQPVVYLSESPAAALLEVCVHTAASNPPPEFTLLRIEGPNLGFATIPESSLAKNWRTQSKTTRTLGTKWLRERRSALLNVPSAIVPFTSNFLFNPLHPDAELFRIVASLAVPFDRRIKE